MQIPPVALPVPHSPVMPDLRHAANDPFSFVKPDPLRDQIPSIENQYRRHGLLLVRPACYSQGLDSGSVRSFSCIAWKSSLLPISSLLRLTGRLSNQRNLLIGRSTARGEDSGPGMLPAILDQRSAPIRVEPVDLPVRLMIRTFHIKSTDILTIRSVTYNGTYEPVLEAFPGIGWRVRTAKNTRSTQHSH